MNHHGYYQQPLRIIVDAACKAFHKSVSAYIAKSRSRPQKNRGDENIDGRRVEDDDNNAANKECLIFELVDHANHVLRTLTAKRTSLKSALLAFREASELHVQQFLGAATGQEDRKRRQIILRNWFANYIRLRDGFVLLESGERRHPHDGDLNINNNNSATTTIHASEAAASSLSRNQKFQSKLNGAFRSDGITRKFSSSNGYTGAGYDEVYDEDVGIKRRLLEALSNVDCKGGRRRRRRTGGSLPIGILFMIGGKGLV